MSNINELKSAIKDILQSNGTLDKIKSEIRQNIYFAIENKNTSKPKLPNENILINELIREYMNFNGYFHSSSVFISETGQPEESPIDRDFIAKELNIIEDGSTKRVPLLYSIIHGFKKEVYGEEDYEKERMNNLSMTMNIQKSNNVNSIDNKISSKIEYYKDQPKGMIINN